MSVSTVRRTGAGVLVVAALTGAVVAVPAVPATEAHAATTSPGYRFQRFDGGKPVRWDPCAPIRYKINPGAGVSAVEVRRVRAAFAATGKALGGVRFVYTGTTRIVPDDVAHAAAARADIVFAFAAPGSGAHRSSMLLGWELARAGFADNRSGSRDGVFVPHAYSGAVVVDARKVPTLGNRERMSMYLHEIGHVVGLDHVEDSRQLMYPSILRSSPATFASGDRAGLARLGKRAGCIQAPGRPVAPTARTAGADVVVAVPPVRSVSGQVRYTLSWGPSHDRHTLVSTTPRFTVPLGTLGQDVLSAGIVRFSVRAKNSVGRSTSPRGRYVLPPVVVTEPGRVSVTPTGVVLGDPTAVLAGTTVAMSGHVEVTGTLTVVARYSDGSSRTFTLAPADGLRLGGSSTVERFEVTGSLTLTPPRGPAVTVPYDGTYTP